jgi:glutamate dehydrogenase/leucine dehydrogenase
LFQIIIFQLLGEGDLKWIINIIVIVDDDDDDDDVVVVGGSGNPSEATAHGVVAGMKAALAAIGKQLKGARVASHGCGTVATFMLEALLAEGALIVDATDVNPRAVERARSLGDVPARLVARGDTSLLATPCDVLALNALGSVLNPTTIPTLNTSYVLPSFVVSLSLSLTPFALIV